MGTGCRVIVGAVRIRGGGGASGATGAWADGGYGGGSCIGVRDGVLYMLFGTLGDVDRT